MRYVFGAFWNTKEKKTLLQILNVKGDKNTDAD